LGARKSEIVEVEVEVHVT